MIVLLSILAATAADSFSVGRDANGLFITDGKAKVYSEPKARPISITTSNGKFTQAADGSFIVSSRSASRRYSRAEIVQVLSKSSKLTSAVVDKSLFTYATTGEPMFTDRGWTVVLSWFPLGVTAGDRRLQDLVLLPVSKKGVPRITGKLMEGEFEFPNFVRVASRYFALSHTWKEGMTTRTYTLDQTDQLGAPLKRQITWPETIDGTQMVATVKDRWIVFIRQIPSNGGDYYVYDTRARQCWRIPIQPLPRNFFCGTQFICVARDAPIIAVADYAASYQPKWLVDLSTRQTTKVEQPGYDGHAIKVIWKSRAFSFQYSGSGGRRMTCKVVNVRSGKIVGELPMP